MIWYSWTTLETFNAWHETVIEGLGFPRVGVNQQTGQPEPEKQQTVVYTAVFAVDPDDWRAPVGDDIAADYPDGLGVPSEPPPDPEPDKE
jgi:hypothetical protein